MAKRVPTPTRCKRRYYIEIQRRADYNGRYPRDDWRAYRQFSVWPILFDTKTEAEDYMASCFTFKGLQGRKLSACVKYTKKTGRYGRC